MENGLQEHKKKKKIETYIDLNVWDQFWYQMEFNRFKYKFKVNGDSNKWTVQFELDRFDEHHRKKDPF